MAEQTKTVKFGWAGFQELLLQRLDAREASTWSTTLCSGWLRELIRPIRLPTPWRPMWPHPGSGW